MNCERCDDLFNDLPWRPAEEGNTHTCQRENLHAPTTNLRRERPHLEHFTYFFPPQAATATATPAVVVLIRPRTKPVGGGVEECVRAACTTRRAPSVTVVPRATSPTPAAEWTSLTPAHVSGSLVHHRHVRWCPLWVTLTTALLLLPLGCPCSTEGTVEGGRCDSSASSCQCKVNVEGPRCDRCKRGYFGLSAANPLGCSSELASELS